MDDAVGPDAKLRQGDLILFDKPESPLRTAGIIVTADCDLEQKKHARLVTLVPVMEARTILERYLLLEDCERKRDLIEAYTFKAHSIDARQDRDTKLTILNSVARPVKSRDSNTEGVATDFVLGVSELILVDSYVTLMQKINSGAKKKDALRDQIRSRGDILVLPDAGKLGISGRIAWIRHIWQVPLGDIAIRTSEVSARPGERIARLDSPFRYRLTQLLAQVFSDIGLPNIEDGMDQAVEDAYSHV
ncbi:hypothetical protein [Sphingomonas sp. PWP1-2]|uniref:hypothetical protein n=1 Tax=Sphingomonas sp. PWP1-2 TaxID=2804558 RepID=UPI003CF65951